MLDGPDDAEQIDTTSRFPPNRTTGLITHHQHQQVSGGSNELREEQRLMMEENRRKAQERKRRSEQAATVQATSSKRPKLEAIDLPFAVCDSAVDAIDTEKYLEQEEDEDEISVNEEDLENCMM